MQKLVATFDIFNSPLMFLRYAIIAASISFENYELKFSMALSLTSEFSELLSKRNLLTIILYHKNFVWLP